MRLLLLLLCLSPSITVAQADFRKGYVIASNADTLYGWVDYRGDLLMSSVCRFKSGDSRDVTEFYPGDIIGYRFLGGRYFVSKKHEDQHLFMEYLINGQLNVYYFRDKVGNHYLLDKDDIKLTELPYHKGKITEDGKTFMYTSKAHQKILSYVTNDAPQFSGKAEEFGEPQHTNLIKFAKNYHYNVCPDQKCIIYEKPIPLLSLIIEASVGLTKFNANLVSEVGPRYASNSAHTTKGLLLNFRSPRTNEKIHFRTGLIQLDTRDVLGSIFRYKMPFQFGYIYPKGKVKPKGAMGVSLYKPVAKGDPFFQSLSAMAGANIDLSTKLGISIAYDIDFIPDQEVRLIPEFMLSNSLSIGLNIKINH